MKKIGATAAIACVLAISPAVSSASGWSLAENGEAFRRVTDKDTFVSVISEAELSRFGITLKVTPDGRIGGRAFGARVTGAWEWRDGYFCRDLNWGSTNLGANCQEVMVSDDLVRFTSDQGKGDYADLRLE